MLKALKTQVYAFAGLALILSLPLLIVIVLGWFLMPFSVGYLREITAFTLLTLIFLCVALLFPKNLIRKYVIYFALIILTFFAFFKLSFYANYGVKISASALFVIFETNATEASDFLKNYFSIKVICILITLCLFLSIALKFYPKTKAHEIKVNRVFKGLSILSLMLAVICIYYRFADENIGIKSIKSFQAYQTAKAHLKENIALTISPNIVASTSDNEPQVHVVVIGESASRWHMQLYGYDRETNPKLAEISDELIVFEDAITPDVYTIIALDKILSLSDFKTPNKKDNISIVQLANAAGYHTYWISNQKPVGVYESIPTLIGSAAHDTYFLSTDNFKYDVYDENLLPTFEKVLLETAPKKIIFLHLIGSHSDYSRRYPEGFDYFKNKKLNAEFSHEKALQIINEYDNSLRYTDFILRSVIEALRSQNANSSMLYFSDHGDEVYDTMNLYGHNEYHGTAPMYEIPFIAWFSQDYKLKHPHVFEQENIEKRPYILEDFIHSFSDLYGIQFQEFSKEKSVFNAEFKIKTRYIKKELDYDLSNKDHLLKIPIKH